MQFLDLLILNFLQVFPLTSLSQNDFLIVELNHDLDMLLFGLLLALTFGQLLN